MSMRCQSWSGLEKQLDLDADDESMDRPQIRDFTAGENTDMSHPAPAPKSACSFSKVPVNALQR